jgi:AcrR family transcriptional regulator
MGHDTTDYAPRTTRAARRAATQARILDAAREEFGDRGFDATTVRGVARRAGVDPSLVLQHYGSKSALFAASIQLPPGEPAEAADHLAEVLKVRAAELPPEMRALVRSMLTVPEASEAVRLHLDERIANLAAALGGPEAELRAAIAVSSILGLTVARHFLTLRAVSNASDDDFVRVASRTLTAGLGTATEMAT